MNLVNLDELLIGVDAAIYLGVSERRIYTLREEGRIGRKVAGIWMYTKTELDQYRATRKGKAGRPKGYSPKHKRREQNSAKKTQRADDSSTNG